MEAISASSPESKDCQFCTIMVPATACTCNRMQQVCLQSVTVCARVDEAIPPNKGSKEGAKEGSKEGGKEGSSLESKVCLCRMHQHQLMDATTVISKCNSVPCLDEPCQLRAREHG